MRSVLLVLCLIVPGLALGQSLGEAAKREKERREQNKQEGKKVRVISEEELFPEEEEEGEAASSGDYESSVVSSGESSPRRRPSSEERARDEEGEYDEEADYVEDVPNHIPPDAPLEERLQIFEKMKRGYEKQVEEIDKSIAENEARLREIENEIAETSALGGAGLPVAPRTGTGTATKQMTGQESAQLVAEQNRLITMNETLQKRKEQLKLDLQAKGRAAGIPPGYLRF